ncbi:MAG TPA: hypothetical protein VHB50_05245 [Bryobacteraceae bacterium]|nr:hypothetical protein [Bryobacteraceae bacterium]
MKTIWCIVWVLGALLVIATLDNVPDPPAASPGASQYTAAVHDHLVGGGVQYHQSPGSLFRLPLRFDEPNSVQPHPRSAQQVVTEQAADPSPPAPAFWRISTV